MKRLGSFLAAVTWLFVSPHAADARAVRIWTEQELLAMSDLVVLATPTANRDTAERGGLPADERQPVIGVHTDFAVAAVLKGPPVVQTVTLHHYRVDAGQSAVANGPTFVSFNPKAARVFRLYLVRQPDGCYAPAAGQEDPGLSVREEYKK